MRSASFPVARALALELGKLGTPIALQYDIGRIAWQLYRSRVYENQPLVIELDEVDSRAYIRLENSLHESGVLQPIPGVNEKSAHMLLGSGPVDHNVVICSLDPFCYLSHLSAMEFHGLTDRMPEQIYVSSPAAKAWTESAATRMAKDLGEDYENYINAGLPQLQRITLKKIGQRPVHRYASIHHGAFRSIKGSTVRVATIGRTFLDMLREPQLCGGLTHVLQAFKEHAAMHRRLIFDELDQHGGPINKVRAGFIMEELCQIRDPRIDQWVSSAARGGSRKLDSSADYEPRFSERWMLSINATVPEDNS